MGVYAKLINIQSKLKAPKNQYNSFGKYNYRNCEDILESLKPLLLEEKATIFISDDIVNIESRFYIKATVTFVDAETGETVVNSALAREEETKKGMDGSQVTGSSSSYARKYALNGMFAIDDTKDADFNNTHGKENKTEDPKKLTEGQVKRCFAIANKKGITPAQIKQKITKEFKKTNIEDLSKQEYDKIIADLEKLADK